VDTWFANHYIYLSLALELSLTVSGTGNDYSKLNALAMGNLSTVTEMWMKLLPLSLTMPY
jgi:hypothetical protein